MTKCARQSTNDFETELLPQTNRGFVSRNNEIELHRAKTEAACFAQAMFAHRAPNSLTTCIPSNHERCIRDVRTTAGLDGPQNIGAENASAVFFNVNPCIRLESIPQGVLARHSRIESIRVPGSNDLAENIPDRVPIRGSCCAYLDHKLDALASFHDRDFPRAHVLATHRRCAYRGDHRAIAELR